MLHSEVNLPIDFLVNQDADAGYGVESATDEGLNAPNTQALTGSEIPVALLTA
ncbi:hypothetical protein MJK71_08345 [Escherichia coli]|nr:hypothetical protein MJK71_08345 [Escherichia coli]